MLDSQKVNLEKYLVLRALGKSDLVKKSDWFSYVCQGGSVDSVSCPFRLSGDAVIGGKPKKLNFSRTPIRRVRAILIDNSIVATHCSAPPQFPFPYRQSPSVARSRIGFGLSVTQNTKGRARVEFDRG